MRLFVAAEIGFVLVALVGVALVSVPASLIIGGVLGVVAMEYRSALRRRALAKVTDLGSRRAAA